MNLKNSIQRCEATWSTELLEDRYVQPAASTLEKIDISSEVGVCDLRVFTLPLGSTIASLDYSFDTRAMGDIQHFMDVKKDYDEATIILYACSSGQLLIKDHLNNKQLVLNAGDTLFKFTDKQEYTLEIDTKENIRAFKLILSKTLLESLLGSKTATQLLERLELNTVPSRKFIKLSQKISNLFQDCLHNVGEGGTIESIEIQGRVLIFLSSMTNFILDDKKFQKNLRHINLARRLHDEIVSMEGRIPALIYFSDKYGLSTKSLNENFKAVYDKTIWAFILEHKLHQAHTILVQSDTAIKSVADELGYANVSHFSNAFRNKYGYSPGQLRR